MGCGEKVKPSTKGFKCTADVVSYENSFSYLIEVPKNGNISATVQNPEGLSGLRYVWNGEGFTVSFNGIEKDIPENVFGDDNFLLIYKKIISQIENGNLIAENGNIKGTDTFGSFSLKVRPDGFIKELYIGGLSLSATFKGYEYLF